MSLFTDSDIVTQADLLRVDGEIASVSANSSPILLVEGPGSVCEEAWIDCQQQILAAMQSYVSYPAQTGMPATHIAAVTNVGVPARTQPRVRLNQIVASDSNYGVSRSAVQTWMIYCALALFYRNASARLGMDRYQEKYLRYRDDATTKWRVLRNQGLPMIYQPLEAPGAKHAFSAGSWSSANITGVAGGSGAAQNVVVAITWYDSSKYTSQTSKLNGESGPSAQISFTIPANQLLKVDITSLIPPTGVADPVGLSSGTWTPLNATHWNIYVGLQVTAPASQPTLYLQKEGVPVATKTWTLAAAPTLSGSVLSPGQYQDLNLVFMNVAMRG